MFEIYEAMKGRKHYLVFDRSVTCEETVKAACDYFRCGKNNLEIAGGWVLNDELYLEKPHKKGAKKVAVVSHWRRFKCK